MVPRDALLDSRLWNDLLPVPREPLTSTVLKGLKSGDVRFKNALSWHVGEGEGPEGWITAFKEAWDNFRPSPDEDFSAGITDDDVPF